MSGPVSRGGAVSSSDVPLIHQCLYLEQISFGTSKYTRSGELRRALGVSLGTEDLPSRASSFRPSPPVSIEELKQIRDSVLNASIKARERSKLFRDSINKLEKYRDSMVSKKRQRTDLLSIDKTGGSSLLKMAAQPPRNSLDLTAQRLEDKAKSAGMNKRIRTSAGELRVESKSGSLSKDQLSNEKETHNFKGVNGACIPEERMLRLSAVGEGWDKNKMKRKRSVGTVVNKSGAGDVNRTMHSELSTDSKPASSDASFLSSGTIVRARISRAPRIGSVMAANSSSDVQASSEACEGWEEPTNSNKVISLDSVQSHHRTANSSYLLGQWGGQRQQKSSRSRRTNVISPVSNSDECQTPSMKFSPPVSGVKNSLNDISGCMETVDVHSNISNSKIKVDNTPSPGLLSEGEETKGMEFRLEEKGTDCCDGLNGKGKMRAFMFPTKRNKNVLNENVGDGVRRQGRTMRGLSLSKPGLSHSDVKLESGSTAKRIQSTRPGLEKIKSKTGRPPSRKISDGRVFTRNSESDDDHEELLAAAAAARKASYNSCSGRFWKKLEPIFGSVSSQDISYMKQQLTLAEELEYSLSAIPSAQYNILGVYLQKENADISTGKNGCHSNQVIDKDGAFSVGLYGGKRLEKFSSLYQRVMSALIEEDESEGIYNGNEGVSVSFQCASDDSHCGSCNYVDTDIKDRDRFDSEAESVVDFQIQKRCASDRFSCNKSVTSNTTRNASMSDSLYSSGRWLGDDGISYSDAEFVGGSWQNDVGGPQPADITAIGAYPDSEYQLMRIDDRLVLELQSVGLYLDVMPDLADGEDVICRDIKELKEGLCEQIGKTKDNLVKIDKAIQDDKDREKRHIEQVAMEQLIQMAYKRRMACRRNNGSKTVMRKVSKQVALGFIERTLLRCRSFELTGRSCFSEPCLQNVLFAAPEVNDTGTGNMSDSRIGHGASKNRMETTKAELTLFNVLDPCIEDLGRGYVDSPQPASRSSEHGFPEFESMSHKGKKREVLLDNVGGSSLRGGTAYGCSLIEGAKGKRSDRDRDQRRGALASAACESQPVVSFSSEQKQKPKIKPKNSTSTQPTSSSVQWKSTEHNKSGNASDVACEGLENIDFDTIDPLDISNDLKPPEDINNWFVGLQDYDSIGLEIPMDDLNMILL
ncbi:uncharacterized protein LOC130812592 isoform X2 [Amaranthus tricolor]|uniref:uncharacterized protein LOC130812592 isoform X2 n=1 Tax=Amaranthus tricolor TaxID=29722 RepID=UPI0025860DA7|nr:uncharacterized protein LOC130812592 isoform X2 [Amaranthus tricolor]